MQTETKRESGLLSNRPSSPSTMIGPPTQLCRVFFSGNVEQNPWFLQLFPSLENVFFSSDKGLYKTRTIDVEAPFSAAVRGSKQWGWVSNVVGVGAGFGILASLMVSMLGQARYLCVIGHSNVVPAWFAKVHPKTATPGPHYL
ncbi:hypothetical protein AAC387_Pa02g2455 [Persea americana]